MNRFHLRDRQPFGPLVVRSKRGVLHRAKDGPRLHSRCAGGRAFIGDVLTPEQAVEWATGRPAVLCRYPWCFREAVRAAGFDPEVGHTSREVRLGRRALRPVRTQPHRASPDRMHEVVENWAWCSCGEVVVQLVSLHDPSRKWWQHKGRRVGRRAA